MQVTMIAVGSRGDVQPYIALGNGLHQAGHAVHILGSQDFRDEISACGLTYFDIGGSIRTVAQGMQGLLESGNFIKILARMGPAAQGMISQAVVSGLAACAGSDLVVAGLGGFSVGVALSEKLGIPFVPAYLYPFTPTREFASVLLPSTGVKLPPWANRLSHRIGQQMIWQAIRRADNKARRQTLDLPAAPFRGPFASLEKDGGTILCGYSRHVIPVPKDWSRSIHVTGYWFLEPAPGWKPPAELDQFLQSGPPPIYIGFGSMVNRRPEQVTDLVLDALERTGQRAVVSTGWGGMQASRLPVSVCMVGSIPHSWLFPQMAAVVHHGGVGTTAAGLRAGIPAVVTPFFGDQPFWGDRVHSLGVGPRPIPRRHLTSDRLADAIRVAVSDTGMRDRAAALGERIRAEAGIGRAVAVLEQRAAHCT